MKITCLKSRLIIVIMFIGVYIGYLCYMRDRPTLDITIEQMGSDTCQIEVPVTAIIEKGNLSPTDKVQKQIDTFADVVNNNLESMREDFLSCDLKLDLKVENGEMIFHYTGPAVTNDGEQIYYDKTTKIDFDLKIDIH